MVLLLGNVDLDTLATPGYYPEEMSITWNSGDWERDCEQNKEDGKV